MTLDLIHSVAQMAGPIPFSTDALYGVFEQIQSASKSAGEKLMAVSGTILAAGVAYRIIRAWMESALYGDAMEVINEAIQTLIVAGLIGMVFKNYGDLCDYAWGLGKSGMEILGSGGETDAKNILSAIWSSVGDTIEAIFSGALTTPDNCGPAPGMIHPVDQANWLVCKTGAMTSSFIGTVLGMPFVLVSMIVMLIFGALMMYQVLRAFVQVAVGLMWLPFTLGFYFFIDSWFRNAVAMITGGLANMAMISFVLHLVLDSIKEITSQIQTGPVLESLGLSKAASLLMMMVFIMALTMMSNSVLTFGSQIFGVPTGGDRLRGPAGKSGGGGGPTPKDGGEGNTPPNSEGAKLAPPNPPSPSPIAMSSQSANAGASLGTAAKAAALAAGTVATGGAGAAVGAAGAAGGAGAGAAAGTAGGAGAAAGGTGAAASGASAGGTGGAGVTGGVGGAGGGTPPTGVVSGGPKDGGSVVSGGQKGGSSAKGFASSAYSKASQGVQRISASPAGRLAAGYGRYAAKTSEAALRFWLAQNTHGFDSKINFTSRKPPQKKE